ncbi:MAG: hypothetical protein WC150_07510 [Bacteroidia bacterium]
MKIRIIQSIIRALSGVFFLSLILSESTYAQYKNCIFHWDKPLYTFVYRSELDSSVFWVQRIRIKSDTLYSSMFPVRFDIKDKILVSAYISDHENEIEKSLDSLKMTIKDTLIRKDNSIKYKNGRYFICTSAPHSYNRKKNYIANDLFFISNVRKLSGRKVYRFTYIGGLTSNEQYSYDYLDDFWILKYSFSSEEPVYSLIDYW